MSSEPTYIFQESGFLKLPLRGSHEEMLATMPGHHDAPFDRVLAAQARPSPCA